MFRDQITLIECVMNLPDSYYQAKNDLLGRSVQTISKEFKSETIKHSLFMETKLAGMVLRVRRQLSNTQTDGGLGRTIGISEMSILVITTPTQNGQWLTDKGLCTKLEARNLITGMLVLCWQQAQLRRKDYISLTPTRVE
jgi:hypothetical protein